MKVGLRIRPTEEARKGEEAPPQNGEEIED